MWNCYEVAPFFPRNLLEFNPEPHFLFFHPAPPGIVSRRQMVPGAAAGGDAVAVTEGSGSESAHSRGEPEQTVRARSIEQASIWRVCVLWMQ